MADASTPGIAQVRNLESTDSTGEKKYGEKTPSKGDAESYQRADKHGRDPCAKVRGEQNKGPNHSFIRMHG